MSTQSHIYTQFVIKIGYSYQYCWNCSKFVHDYYGYYPPVLLPNNIVKVLLMRNRVVSECASQYHPKREFPYEAIASKVVTEEVSTNVFSEEGSASSREARFVNLTE